MKIGVDYHGVINAQPDFFRRFNELALEKGFELVVLSGGSKKDVETFLLKNKIPYTSVFSILDDFNAKNMVTFYEDGSFFVPNEIWNKSKAKYCLEHHVDVHIDDSMLYGSYFQTPFCLYAPTQEKCNLLKTNIRVDFNQAPECVLDDLIKLISSKHKA
ncbi:MAG: hypothetical protein IJ870_02450 [Alphaproteobacteria bacterium]|nr:hypothetical protein [Alphaproteobacteria bacterium]